MKTYKFCFLFLAMLMAMSMTANAAYKADKNYLDSLTKVAEQGDVEAQKEVGFEYELEKKYTEAEKWYRKAAEQGDAHAQVRLGDLYYEGNGVKQDYTEAAKWYRKAAEQGYAIAQAFLGDLYFYGDGVKQDYTEAAKWYRKAAEQGDAYAQLQLGDLYYEGNGVKQDFAEAAKWYLQSAEQGKGYAQKRLGDLYAQGKGIQQDYTEAAKWYRKAAEQGKSTAQMKLGVCYAIGKGVERNYSQAANLIFKGLKDLLVGRVFIFYLLLVLFFLIISFLYTYKKYIKAGLKKSQSLLISSISTLLGFIPAVVFGSITGFLMGFVGLSLPNFSDYLILVCIPVILLLVNSLIVKLLAQRWKASTENSSVSSEGENEIPEDTLMDGKKGHKIKINIATAHIISFAAIALAFIVGLPYYWFVTKALGHEPFSRLTDFMMGSASMEDSVHILINLSIFLVALILGLIACTLLHRLGWGWRNTSSRMDWKNMVVATYCNKIVKKSQYIKGVIMPFFILGLLPLLVSPFINSIGTCLFGIIFIATTAPNFIYAWKLRKEPRNCMIQDIKGEYAFFVFDEEQPADNE